MTAHDNTELLRRYVAEVWDHGKTEALADYLSPKFKRHLSPVEVPLDRDSQIQRLIGFRAAFPDVTLTVEDITAEDDRVAFRSTMRGTHLGEFAGIPATGVRVTVQLLDVVRIEDRRFIEQWGGPDMYDLLRQLGSSFSPPN